MYTVKGEEYICDYNRRPFTKVFDSLDDIENWIFGMMKQEYSKHMYFPTGDRPSRIEINPDLKEPNIWIYLISSDKGIEFTSGKLTDGQRHWSKRIREWLQHCNERKSCPQFTFVD